MSHLVQLTFDRTVKGEKTCNVKVAAIPVAAPDNRLGFKGQTFDIRSVTIEANPKAGEPVAYIRLRGSID